jgi:mRNA-degrading endonuclease RelE of RelBE toxin-antitoxin system
MFELLTTHEFDRDMRKLDNSAKQQVERVLLQLQENPHSGKPLGYTFFREKKIGKHRIYYLIYDNFLVVFVIAMSEKKDQQKTIDAVKALIPFYKKEIDKKFMQ